MMNTEVDGQDRWKIARAAGFEVPENTSVLIGRQGNEEIWANDLAKLCRTIPYEILTSIKPSLEHRYIG